MNWLIINQLLLFNNWADSVWPEVDWAVSQGGDPVLLNEVAPALVVKQMEQIGTKLLLLEQSLQLVLRDVRPIGFLWQTLTYAREVSRSGLTFILTKSTNNKWSTFFSNLQTLPESPFWRASFVRSFDYHNPYREEGWRPPMWGCQWRPCCPPPPPPRGPS